MRFFVFVQLFLPLIAFNTMLTANDYYSSYGYENAYDGYDSCNCCNSYNSCCFGNGGSFFPIAGDITLAYDNFRSLPEGSWNGNTGAYLGANFGIGSAYGFGAQLGGSYGLYDWAGRGSNLDDQNDLQQQGFVTVGLYRKAICGSGLNFGLVYDWTYNKDAGVFALNTEYDQLRYQAGYLFNASDEIGFWGTAALRTTHKEFDFIPVSYRAIGQINLFWKHYFCNCAQTMLWIGAPYNHGLMFSSKRDGKFIVGACFKVPLTRSLSIEGHGMYMTPQDANQFGNRSFNVGSNIAFGLTYTFGNNCGCDCNYTNASYPYMPIADNSRFISDTSLSF